MKYYSANNSGLALMMVLWILILLGALATEFAYSMRTEVNATKNYKEDIESYYLAKAGINMGIAEIYKDARFHSIHPEFGFITGKKKKYDAINTQPNLENKETALKQDFGKSSQPFGPDPDEDEDEAEFEIIERNNISLGNGFINYQISDENGKVNINSASREILVKTLEASGVARGEENSTIANSILDWIDNNENHRINGAESDYYLNLDSPYKAKNGLFDSLDELLKIRGMSEEILYGNLDDIKTSPENTTYLGLINFLTIQNVKSFNPNTADPALLPIFFSEIQTQAILEAIKNKGYFDDSKSTHFKIESTGFVNGSANKRTIVAVFEKLDSGNKATLLIRYWNDNALQS